MLVAFVSSQPDDPAYMDVKSAGCVAIIERANRDEIGRANALLQRIIDSSLQGLDVPSTKMNAIKRSLLASGQVQIDEKLPR